MTEETKRKNVKVVVLGDIGRSPRMQYHALSLANAGLNVNIIGYVESKPLTELLKNPLITVTTLQPLVFNAGPRLFQYALKAFWQSVSLFLTLLVTGKCDFLLCQNPPAIPTLPVCRFYCLVTRTKFVIDWHNYAYSIMALTLPPKHMLVKISRFIEKYFGQSAQNNICVTYAMKQDLHDNWNIVAKVLHDRPPKRFRTLTLEEKHIWFLKIGQEYAEFACSGREKLNHPSGEGVTKTAFTQMVGQQIEARKDRPGLLFSSTSWTPDEDFGVLMKALEGYENKYIVTKRFPKLVCVITGKGPMKQHYLEKISERNWQHVKVVTPWLEADDYPTMVGSADLGVCLHTSSSGLDLPMKVVDMFGAGLPVCAFEFKCLNELVQNGVNGYTFKDSAELTRQLESWFENFPNNEAQNRIAEEMRNQIKKFQESNWESNWNLRIKDFFE